MLPPTADGLALNGVLDTKIEPLVHWALCETVTGLRDRFAFKDRQKAGAEAVISACSDDLIPSLEYHQA